VRAATDSPARPSGARALGARHGHRPAGRQSHALRALRNGPSRRRRSTPARRSPSDTVVATRPGRREPPDTPRSAAPAAHRDPRARPPSGQLPPQQARRHCDASAFTALRAPDESAAYCVDEHLDAVLPVPSRPPPSSRAPEASGVGGARQACFPTGAHARGVCHHCCRRIPRDHARTRAQGAPVFTAFDHPRPFSLQDATGERHDQ